MPSETSESFSVERHLRNSRKLDLAGIDWDDVPNHPLNQDELDFLQYAMDIEDHTIIYLKELLGTKAVHDPDVTAFLSCWAYEEHFHGLALERFLNAYLGPSAPRRDMAARMANEGRLKRAAKKLLMPALARLTPDFAAIHMTWGATNELTTLTGYEQLIRRTQHPILRDVLQRIVKDERRHFAFYYQEARQRLNHHARNRSMTRWLMERAWRPVGTGVYDPVHVDSVGAYVFGDLEGQAALQAANDRIAKLPGMDGWTGLNRQVRAGMERARAASAA